MERRRPHLEAHRRWVDDQTAGGRSIRSGFLVDSGRRPGGGGLLIFEAESYDDALLLVQQDPMIRPASWLDPAGMVPSAGMAGYDRCTSPAW